MYSLLHITFAVLKKPCQGKFGKFQGSGKSSFSIPKKYRYFFKIPKWQHKLDRDNRRGKSVPYFLNINAKSCLYGLKISENIDIERVFEYRAFSHLK